MYYIKIPLAHYTEDKNEQSILDDLKNGHISQWAVNEDDIDKVKIEKD